MNRRLRWPRASDDADVVDRVSLGDLLAMLALIGTVVIAATTVGVVVTTLLR